MTLFDSNKSATASIANNTPGANLSHRFVSAPGQRHFLRVASHNVGSMGAYLLRVRMLKSYDRFEPNETALAAKSINLDSSVDAEISDNHDVDYFKVATGRRSGTMLVKLVNRSSTLRPYLHLFDSRKSSMREGLNDTLGADLEVTQKVLAGHDYFVRVQSYNNNLPGKYTLTVSVK